MNRPFDFHPDGRVPDGNPNSTMQLLDYYDDNGVNTPAGQGGSAQLASLVALGVMYAYGQNLIRERTYDMFTCTARNNSLYGPIYFWLSQDGTIISLDAESQDGNATTATSAFWSNDPVNQEQITGAINGFSFNSGLTNALRVLSAGVRLWPTIELVTDSNTLAVSRYYGAQVTAASINTAFENGDNFFSIMRNSPSYQEYSNSQGISGRFQPYQQGSVLKPLNLNSLALIADENMDTNGLYYQVVLARTTQTVQWVATANITYGFPVRSFFRTILEGSLTQPTPLQATRMPYVSDWEDKVCHQMYRTDLFPTIVSGHSFKKVMKAVVNALGKNKEVQQIVGDVKNMLAQLKLGYNTGRNIVSTGQRITKLVKQGANLSKGQKKKLKKRMKSVVKDTALETLKKVVNSQNSGQSNSINAPLLDILRASGGAVVDENTT